MYRIIRVDGRYYAQKHLFWCFWIACHQTSQSFEVCEQLIKELQANTPEKYRQVIRTYD